jgi:hypothetical protein
MGDGRRAGVDHGCRLLAWQPLEQTLAHGRRRELEETPDLRREQTVERFLVVRVPGERPGDARRVQGK